MSAILTTLPSILSVCDAVEPMSSELVAAPIANTFSLVIPTLCEAGNIAALLCDVRAALDPMRIAYEIVVVDDDSCDGTGDIVSAIAATDDRVRLLVRRGERGLSGAILHGWGHTDASILAVMDADRQHPPEMLPTLVEAILSGSDLAIASRYACGGCVGKWGGLRRMFSSVAVMFTVPLQRSGVRICDPMSGFFAVRRECLPREPLQKSGFKLLLEIFVRGRVASVEEIPFSFGLRSRGASKAGVRTAWCYAVLLARLYAFRLRMRLQPV